MKTKLILFSIVLFLLQTVSLKAQTNLVTNGSFEEVGEDGKPTGWEYNGSNVTWSTSSEVSDIPDGEKVLDVSASSRSSREIGQLIQGIVPGGKYRYPFKYNIYREMTHPDELSCALVWSDESMETMDDYTFLSDLIASISNEWFSFEDEITAPEGAVAAYVAIGFYENLGFYVDDVRLVAVSSDAGIDEIRSSLPVRVSGGQLIVTAAAGSRIEVYNSLGMKLQSQTAGGGETVFQGLPKGQILIVRSSSSVAKVVL
ncbi:MAG: hypothetical protein LBG15_03315 [Dysgonamonadaceae bacterium]|nr:hypothetical protein [Dysgonamonadaceae bacterium]